MFIKMFRFMEKGHSPFKNKAVVRELSGHQCKIENFLTIS